MGKVLCRMLAIIVLVGALANFTTLLRTSPAFNGAERMESVLGGWRVPNVASHYDKAEYQLELAYGYLNELGMIFDPETEKMVMIDADEMNARTSKALEHIDTSLRLDPANASAWVYLAQAHRRNNEIEEMRKSLNRSWELAPHNRQLAPLRLSLVMTIDQSRPFSKEETAAIRRDGAVLQKSAPGYLTRLSERSETLKSLLDAPQDTNS